MPAGFCLERLVRKSALAGLPPLCSDGERGRLEGVLCLPGPRAVDVGLRQDGPGGPLRVQGLRAALLPQLRPQLRHVLGLGEDLRPFYALSDRDPALAWARHCDAGRTLRSPTVFEELVKALCLARGSVRATRRLLVLLCAELGPRAPSGRHGFPDAAAMAAAPLSFYRKKLAAGALAVPLLHLARRCAAGTPLPDSLRREAPASTGAAEGQWEERLQALLDVLIGVPAADRMLPLLGCHDGLRLDYRVRQAWRRLRDRPKWSDRSVVRDIVKTVTPLSCYRGLALRLLLEGPSG